MWNQVNQEKKKAVNQWILLRDKMRCGKEDRFIDQYKRSLVTLKRVVSMEEWLEWEEERMGEEEVQAVQYQHKK